VKAFSLVVLVFVASSLAALAAVQEATAKPRPCVRLDLSYSPHVVRPGELFEFQESLTNCSQRTRSIRVRIDAFGPCDFLPSSSAVYRLGPDSGFTGIGLAFVPSCRGRYRVVGKAIVRGRIVDRARAGFTVVAP
jgi:hypothetical protein